MRPSEDLLPLLKVLATAGLAIPLTWIALFAMDRAEVLGGATNFGVGAALGATCAVAATCARRRDALVALVALPTAWVSGLLGCILLLVVGGYQAG